MGNDIENRGVWRWLLALLLVTLIIFGYSAAVRWHYLDDMGTWNHQWLTSFTVKVVRNWLNEGACSDAFLMLENPASIEFPDLVSRVPYISYPPGAVLPVWLLAKVFTLETAGELVVLAHLMNLFSQLIVAWLLSISAFLLIRDTNSDPPMAFMLSISVPIAWLLLPSHMWWGQQVYFADQAVILPVTLLIFLEVLRPRPHCISDVALEWITTFIGFWACLTDWYGIIVVATLFIKRLLDGTYTDQSWNQRLGQGARFISGPLLAMVLWVYQIYQTGHFSVIWETFLFRTRGDLPEGSQTIISGWIPQAYSWLGLVILILSFFITIFALTSLRHQKKDFHVSNQLKALSSMSTWVMGACILHTSVLWSHSGVHSFSAFKYGLCLSFISFGLIPATILAMRPLFNKERVTEMTPRRRRFVIFAILGPILAFILPLHTHWRNFGYLEFQQDTVYDWAVEDMLDELTGYEDVVFSTTYEIPILPPHQLARSAKRVYLADDYSTMRAILDPIEGDYNICLFYPSDDPGWMSWAAQLEHQAYTVEGYTFIRIDKAVWLNYLVAVDA